MRIKCISPCGIVAGHACSTNAPEDEDAACAPEKIIIIIARGGFRGRATRWVCNEAMKRRNEGVV